MRRHQVTARLPCRFAVTTDSAHSLPVAPNRLAQDFRVDRPNAVWSGDITYLWTGEGWLYLSVVLDLFSRRVVGWHLSRDIDTRLTLAALTKAIAAHRPCPGLIHHSDRGIQYASGEYVVRLGEIGASPRRSGRVLPTAAQAP